MDATTWLEMQSPKTFHFPSLSTMKKPTGARGVTRCGPAVYLIDKQGYVRFWWYGELNWQGSDGHKIMRKRIAELIAEDA